MDNIRDMTNSKSQEDEPVANLLGKRIRTVVWPTAVQCFGMSTEGCKDKYIGYGYDYSG